MLDFIRGDEAALTTNPDYKPLTSAFAVVRSEKGYMLQYNKYRRLWEITGGMIEQGESPRDCVIRECLEESGQTLSDVTFLGLSKLFLRKNAYRPENQTVYSAVYSAWVENIGPFEDNEEIEALRWWHRDEPIEHLCSESLNMINLSIS